jgi:hypothetical protein
LTFVPFFPLRLVLVIVQPKRSLLITIQPHKYSDSVTFRYPYVKSRQMFEVDDLSYKRFVSMKTWTKTWKHGQGHGNMDEDMEKWTRIWKHGRGHGNMDEDTATLTRTWNMD